jgi:steroid delta-isomerase-like uncharacterized protein
MSTESNKALVNQFIEAWSKHTPADVESLVTEDWTNHDPNLPPLPQGPEGARLLVSQFVNAIPDLQATVDAIIAEGDLVAARCTYSGTHTGELLGIPPTGKTASVTATGFFRIVNGKIAENRVNFDALGLMQQLGVIPMLGQPAQVRQ